MTDLDAPRVPPPPASTPQADVTPHGTMGTPAKLRRRPQLWALGIALIALGALLAAWITATVGDTTQVLVLDRNVDRGEVVEAADLRSVAVAGDPSIATISADRVDEVIGMRAARDLTEGTLLAHGAITDEAIPAAGETLVGILLLPGQLPAQQPRPGDTVRIVGTPRQQEDVSEANAGSIIEATVIAVSRDDVSGQFVVDVTVPTSESAKLAALVATGRIALVIDGA